MTRLKDRLAAVAKRLGLMQPRLARARRRYKANRKRAFKAHAKQLAAQKNADRLRSEGKDATGVDARASRYGHTAHKNHARAQVWLGRIKVLVQKLHGLQTTEAALEAKAEAWRKTHGIEIRGNEVTGGSPRARLLAAAHASAAACASGARPNFYSQEGEFDVSHCITGPAYGHRDDCSSWETSAHKSAGLPDPNREEYRSGYTGTLPNRGHEVSRGSLVGGEAVLYGDFPYHHTEMVDDPARETTIGHGSAPVDAGVIDLFGPDEKMTFWRYV